MHARWNAESIGEYWSLWNMLVHEWMVKHIFVPMKTRYHTKWMARWFAWAFRLCSMQKPWLRRSWSQGPCVLRHASASGAPEDKIPNEQLIEDACHVLDYFLHYWAALVYHEVLPRLYKGYS